jgi:hypothetical protein
MQVVFFFGTNTTTTGGPNATITTSGARSSVNDGDCHSCN